MSQELGSKSGSTAADSSEFFAVVSALAQYIEKADAIYRGNQEPQTGKEVEHNGD